MARKTDWVNNQTNETDRIGITSRRVDKVPGTHTISYGSDVDTIELKHTAHSREGFARGVVAAAEFLNKKIGVYGMKDLINT